MCGIAGLLTLGREVSGGAPVGAIAGSMADTLHHRGPDDGGVWHDVEAGVALTNRRLAILDLSPLGHQPMVSPCGRYVLAFNGEAYNYRRLRTELAAAGSARAFRGDSDTEVVTHALTFWGVEKSIEKVNGMFALAVWDRQERELTLARDRLGQKPLYFGWGRQGRGAPLLFGSEVKALHAVPDFAPEIDRQALPLLFRHGAIPAPWSIYRGVWKLPPGHLIRLRPASLSPGEYLGDRAIPYWSAVEAIERGSADPFPGSIEEAADALEELLGDAVGLCLASDVPLGALLSGGVDSSLIAALMTRRASGSVRTYSIGFSPGRYDEAPHAAGVARHLGTEHEEMYVGEADALAVVPDLPSIYDEPFADPSQIPTYLVCRLARQHVTVSLTGDGGDEVFGGYPKYRQLASLLRLAALPNPLRAGLGGLARQLPFPAAPWWDRRGRLGERISGLEVREKASKLAPYLTAGPGGYMNADEITVRLLSLWNDPTALLPPNPPAEPPTGLTDPSRWPRVHDPIRRAMAADTLVYLPADVLAKVDRAAMAVSLETRVPLLDHRVLELAARFPRQMVSQKTVLRRVLHRHVPPELVDRPKMGFSVPLDAWLRGELREWAEALLDPARLRSEGWLAEPAVTDLWQRHRSGREDVAAFLWPALMFQAWHERWASSGAEVAAAQPSKPTTPPGAPPR